MIQNLTRESRDHRWNLLFSHLLIATRDWQNILKSIVFYHFYVYFMKHFLLFKKSYCWVPNTDRYMDAYIFVFYFCLIYTFFLFLTDICHSTLFLPKVEKAKRQQTTKIFMIFQINKNCKVKVSLLVRTMNFEQSFRSLI